MLGHIAGPRYTICLPPLASYHTRNTKWEWTFSLAVEKYVPLESPWVPILVPSSYKWRLWVVAVVAPVIGFLPLQHMHIPCERSNYRVSLFPYVPNASGTPSLLFPATCQWISRPYTWHLSLWLSQVENNPAWIFTSFFSWSVFSKTFLN